MRVVTMEINTEEMFKEALQSMPTAKTTFDEKQVYTPDEINQVELKEEPGYNEVDLDEEYEEDFSS